MASMGFLEPNLSPESLNEGLSLRRESLYPAALSGPDFDSVEPDYGLPLGLTFGRVKVLQVHEILAAPGGLLHRT